MGYLIKDYVDKMWLLVLFVVKVIALKQQISYTV